MKEFKKSEQASIVIKILSMLFLIVPMFLTVASLKLSDSNIFSIDVTTISANAKLDTSFDQAFQQSIQEGWNAIAYQHLLFTGIAIILLIGSIYLTYINQARWSGVLTAIAGFFTFLLFIRYFVLDFGLGFYLLMLVTPLLVVSAVVKFFIKEENALNNKFKKI